jgi:TRAP-type mannitol/chloroaromatic compound transport system permease small subunit|tara:strand:- start:3448 stop:4434 length:987 start_codon:yes stop_codon:yes gene_type:complete
MNETSVKRQVVNRVWQRYLGWTTISLLTAFLINNFLNIYFGFEGVSRLYISFSGTALISLVIYIAAVVMAVWQVKRTLDESYRQQATYLHNFNVYFLRGCFFAVLFIGCVDFTLALLRSVDVLKYLVDDSTARALGLGNVVGPYIHVPLTILGFVVARFSRTLGWTWLALLIVFAELIIVISRYLFSYEQSFMADLVRYWYAALFLFASAYTLYEEGHVRVDVIYAGLSDKVKAYVNAWGSYFLGVITMIVVVLIGFNGKTSIINSPLLVFEITNQGINGMFIKYQMAMFLGIFGATMLVQFIVQFFESLADINQEPGKRDTSIQLGH